ncbi:MAG: PAS domain S-box protein [Planctomycetota bacterium]|mgnify:CR=1 FL=1|nr:MAG: PAS domain S-box protein [Planctomycetota bacterium]
MFDFFAQLFSAEGFPPRWQCGDWSSFHGWLYIVSDLGVWSAYTAIPAALAYFVWRKRAVPFRGVFLLFIAFIMACGLTHLLDAVMFWWPGYRLLGLVELITAVVSWATVVVLVPMVPRALALRTPEELEREIEARRKVESELQRANEDLERRVAQRTAELEEANATLVRERTRFETTLASIGDAVIATDTSGHVTFANPVAETLTGWSVAEMVGQPLNSVFEIVHEQTRQPAENPAYRALSEGAIVGLANYTVLIDKEGVERPIDDSAAPIRGDDGRILGVVLTFRDVTLQRSSERLLVESEEKFRTMADSIPQLAWMTEPDGFIVWYNQRWYDYTGTTFEEMKGWRWRAVHDPDHVERVVASWKAAIARGEPWEDTFPLRRHDGAMRWHLSRAVPVRHEGGEIAGWFGTNTDITERLEMEETLKEEDRRKNLFLSTLAHELRNPLATISNALQLWPMVQDDKAEMQQLRTMAERQLQQLVRLIDDLLEVSRITRGKIEVRPQPTDLRAIVTDVIATLRRSIESHDHLLHVELPESPVIVNADVTRMTQVFTNLLNNADKYTPSRGEITIRLEQAEGRVLLSVRDNGLGIPKGMLTKIFEMFQQVDSSPERSQGGLGIGLTLARELVDMHGGTIEAKSEGPGTGSEFVVTLPALAATADAESRPTEEPTAAEGALPRLRVLVVDDVQASAKTLGKILEKIGQDVAVVTEPAAAIEHVRQHHPDVVFLDIAMPGMNGYDVARCIRADAADLQPVIVALTGYGQEEDRQAAYDAGFNRHMTKPANITALKQLLSSLSSPKTPPPQSKDVP